MSEIANTGDNLDWTVRWRFNCMNKSGMAQKFC